MKLLIIFTFIFCLSSCQEKTTTATPAIGAGTMNKCIIGRWSDSALPLNLKMSSDFTGDYSAVNLVGGLNPLEQMAKVWNDVIPSKPLMTTPFSNAGVTGYTSTTAFRDGEIGIYKSQTWFANVTSDALAITQFYGVVTSSPTLGQYINLTHADIIVNYRDYGSRMSMVDNPMFEYDVPTIVLHEMGHLLGLCHETSKPSIMMPRYVTTQHSLQNFDKNIIKNLYIDNAISSAITAKSATKTNSALDTNQVSFPDGTEVKGIIELHASGKCIHYMNGKKVYEHTSEALKK